MSRPSRSDCPIPVRLNAWIFSAQVLLNLFQFLVLPAWLLPLSPWWLLALPPLAALTPALWALIHEAIHGNLHPDRARNRQMGRVLCVLFGTPFLVPQTFHLLHHRFNRTEKERIEVYDPGRTGRWRAAAAYYGQLLGGLYFSLLLSPLLFFVPAPHWQTALRRVAHRHPLSNHLLEALTRADAVSAIRRDAVAALGLLALSGLLYALAGHGWAFVAMLSARAFAYSFLDYLYHYGSALGDRLQGYNLALPAWASRGLLHFNHHGCHHENPAIPWVHLQACFHAAAKAPDQAYWRAALAQLRGPITVQEAAVRGKRPAVPAKLRPPNDAAAAADSDLFPPTQPD